MRTARVLERLGRQVRCASLREVARAPAPYWPAGVAAIVEAAGDEPVVLALHSNSGLYAPAVVDALGDQVRGVVFVDAALPGSGAYAQRDFLAGLAGPDGLLPPWTEWWDEVDVAALFPDSEMRAQVEAEQARLPLAYYDTLPPAHDGWDRMPCAYVWFGDPYDQAAARARTQGWPIRHVPGRHLHMLVDPDAVAAALVELTSDWR